MKQLLIALAIALLAGPALAQAPAPGAAPWLSNAGIGANGSGAQSPAANNNLGTLGVSVVGQGADNTGATSVSTIVQNMVNAGTNSILFPAGTYSFFNAVVLNNGKTTTIQCERGKTTLIAGASHASDAALFFWVKAGSTLVMRDCIVDGNMLDVGNDECYVQTTGSNDDVFENNIFTNDRGEILCFTNSARVIVRNNRFTNTGWWWQHGGSSAGTTAMTFNGGGTDELVIGNNADTIGGGFVNAGPVSHFIFANNKVIGANNGVINLPGATGQGAIYPELGSDHVVIVGNEVYGLTGNGIDIHCTNDFIVVGNSSNHNGGAGIAISGAGSADTVTCNASTGAADVHRFVVSGNQTNDNWQGTAGVVSLSTNGTTASGNNVLHFASTTGVVNGMYISTANVPQATTVVSFDATTVTMSANATGGGVANPQTVLFLPQYPNEPQPDAGIWLGCVNTSCNITDFSIDGLTATDDQTPKTQNYGVDVVTATLSNYRLSSSSQLAGNLTAATHNILQVDQGSGSNAWACWPGSAVTASGNFGSMACGFNTTASGVGALALGTSVVADGAYSAAFTHGVTARGRYGAHCNSGTLFSVNGDAQHCSLILRGSGASSGGSVQLTADGAAAGAANCVNIPNNTIYQIHIRVVGIDHTAPANNTEWGDWNGLMTRGANAAATTLAMDTTPTPKTNGTVTGQAISATADTTLGCLNLTMTHPTNTDTWNYVAFVETIEVQ